MVESPPIVFLVLLPIVWLQVNAVGMHAGAKAALRETATERRSGSAIGLSTCDSATPP